MDPLVSFVVPCYKLAHLLPDCVQSILAQTYRNFEVLIMDNCSPDNTQEVATSFHDPRVSHIRNELNIGHLRNFNKGITMARGKYVWLVSADDFLLSPYLLQRFVDVMERNPHVGYVFSRAVEGQGSKDIGSVLSFTDCGRKDKIWKGATFLKRLVRNNCIVMSSVMVRKECYDKITVFPLDMPYAGDWYLWSVFALCYDVAYISDPMVCWRIHEESLSAGFARGEAPVRIIDDLNVLWRVARQAELAGVSSLRGGCNASIAGRIVGVLKSDPVDDSRPGLTQPEFETMLRRNVRDPKDEEDLRARVYIALGDKQYTNGEYAKATESYWIGLKFRPWWLKSSAKYLLLRTGRLGIGMRQLSSSIRGRGNRAMDLYIDVGHSELKKSPAPSVQTKRT